MNAMDATKTHVIDGTPVVLPGDEAYRVGREDELLTPALLVFPEIVDANIRAIVGLLGGDAGRWRAHVKSAKIASVMRQLVEAGVSNLKCATPLELRVACDAGASDVLVAYPVVGPAVARVAEIARAHRATRVSALVEAEPAVAAWRGTGVGLFVDVNPGMDRTGIADTAVEAIASVARAIARAGIRFGGLHYYDGQVGTGPGWEARAHAGYDRLIEVVAALEKAGLAVPEVITAGTPAFAASLSYPRFAGRRFLHRVSPGTVVYCDATSAAQLPPEWGLRPAAVVASRVISHPAPGRVTLDAGHKSVSADAGVPTCAIAGVPWLTPLKPSEEHLPVAVPEGRDAPPVGRVLYLVPRHVCPTVNNFDHAAIVREGRIEAVEAVAARGRERPLTAAR
ncbi:MAG TPA: alanine racemase [Vicinamibacterales bacterium]|nr:alanine racemase [Vicinamibacterales bacterium]